MKFFRIFLLIYFLFVFTSSVCRGACQDNKIEWDGIYSDQTELFMAPLEPDPDEDITLNLRTYKKDVTACRIRYWDGGEHFADMKPKENNQSGIYDLWTGTIPAGNGKKTYRFEVSDGIDRGWYTSIGRMKEPVYDRDFVIIPGFKTPDWMKNAVVYQIFPDRFFDGEPENNVKNGEYIYMGSKVYTHKKWSDIPDNPTKCADFFGGDLQGVKEKLSYLKDLGITVIYLNPIFLSPSNHKYDTQDYRQVDPHFGGNEALKALVRDAHDCGIRIILDGVFNHTGSKHYWFDKEHIYDTVGAYESKDSPWADFYTFREWPDNYLCWWGFDTLPKLDYGSPGLRNEIYAGENSIARMWIKDYKIDGWRLDVPNEAGVGGRTDEHGIWKGFRQAVKSSNSDAYITGEIWGSAYEWLDGTQFDGVMNYNGFMEPVWRWLSGIDHNGYPSKMNVSQLDQWLTYTRGDYYFPCTEVNLNLIDSHDTKRFLSVAGGDWKKLRLAVILQMTYAGAPMIYYGDEIGTEGGKDPDCRRTFNWDKSFWKNDIRELYRKLISIRNTYKVMRTGSFNAMEVNDEENIYAFGRFDETHKFIIVLNGGEKNSRLKLPVRKLDIEDGVNLKELLYGKEYVVNKGEIEVEVGPEDGLIIGK